MKNSIVNQNEFFIMILIIFFNSPWNFCARVESVDDIFWIASRVFFSITCFANCAVFISICVVQHDPADGTSQYRRLSEKSRKKMEFISFLCLLFCYPRVSMLRPTHRIMQFECISQPSVILMRISESVLFSFNEWKKEKSERLTVARFNEPPRKRSGSASTSQHNTSGHIGERPRPSRERGWEQNEEGEK